MKKAFKTEEGRNAVWAYYNDMLTAITVPYEEIQVPTRHGQTSLIVAGKEGNPPVFLLHGSSMSSIMWVQEINELSENYRVYAPDMPGEPGKSAEEQLPFDTNAYVEWIEDLFKEFDISKATLVGLSLGGWLATKFTITNPEMVEKLVIMCPAGIGSQNHEFKDIAMEYLMKGEEGADELLTLISGGVEIPEKMLNYQKLIGMTYNSRQEEIPIFSDEELERIMMPTLLIVGGKDIMLKSYETAERIKEHVPNAEINLVPDAGHSLVGFTKDILEFISR